MRQRERSVGYVLVAQFGRCQLTCYSRVLPTDIPLCLPIALICQLVMSTCATLPEMIRLTAEEAWNR